MKELIEALEFCKSEELYTDNIKIALGVNKLPKTVREALNQLKIKNG